MAQAKETKLRKIVSAMHISLNGVIESPEQWVFPHGYSNDEMMQAIGSGMAAADTMLLGRVTYQCFAAHWPRQTGDIADYMNNTPKLVVSTTPLRGPPRTRARRPAVVGARGHLPGVQRGLRRDRR